MTKSMMTLPKELLPFAIPVAMFLISTLVPPSMFSDSGYGFLVLRSMLEGSAFNYVVTPDPADISRDMMLFQTWWSPGQHLIPGIFISMGIKAGPAVLLTALAATCAGLAGWATVARRIGAKPYVVSLFVIGLASFRFNTLGFRIYNGGEMLLFAVAPWSLLALMRCMELRPLIAFAITLLVAVLLFIMKLTGLIVFSATVLALSAVDIARKRGVSRSIFTMWLAAGTAALLLEAFWLSRGQVPTAGAQISLSLTSVLFPLAASAFSGISGLELVAWLVLHPSRPLLPNLQITAFLFGPLAILIAAWVWIRLRGTPYRVWAVHFGAIILIYSVILGMMYLKGSSISYEERHFRYAGILFLLLFLLAAASEPSRWRYAATFVVLFFALYGITSYVIGVQETHRSNRFDPVSGMTQVIVSPAVLRYLRDRQTEGSSRRAIAVLPSPEAALGLPGYRIIALHLDFTPIDVIAKAKWSGKASKIYVVVQEKMLVNGKAGKLLDAFVDYDPAEWWQTRIDGFVVFNQ